MTAEKLSAPIKKFLPGIFRDLLFIIKRVLIVAPYINNMADAYHYFSSFRKNSMSREPLIWFQFSKFSFGARPIDWYTVESLILEEEYGPIKYLFLDQNPSVIIDAGANIGLFSIYVLSLWPNVKVFSIEASPETYEILKLNHNRNPANQWNIQNYAVWGEDGYVNFSNDGFSSGWHVTKETSHINVPSIRLDSFIDKHVEGALKISLLKIDIEGAEEIALLASQHILEHIESLLMEIHAPMSNKEVIIDVLKTTFEFIYDISDADEDHSHLTLLIASRKRLPEEIFFNLL